MLYGTASSRQYGWRALFARLFVSSQSDELVACHGMTDSDKETAKASHCDGGRLCCGRRPDPANDV